MDIKSDQGDEGRTERQAEGEEYKHTYTHSLKHTNTHTHTMKHTNTCTHTQKYTNTLAYTHSKILLKKVLIC